MKKANKVRVQTWIKPTDKKQLESLAARLGVSVSGYINTLIRMHIDST